MLPRVNKKIADYDEPHSLKRRAIFKRQLRASRCVIFAAVTHKPQSVISIVS